jgi:hypothetical protein
MRNDVAEKVTTFVSMEQHTTMTSQRRQAVNSATDGTWPAQQLLWDELDLQSDQQQQGRHAPPGVQTYSSKHGHHAETSRGQHKVSANIARSRTSRKQRQPSPPSPRASAHLARANMSLLSHVGEGRLDPFGIYPQNNLPKYVHHAIKHTLDHVLDPYLTSSEPQVAHGAKTLIMREIVSTPLMWYPVLMSSITHHAFVHALSRPNGVTPDPDLLRAHKMLRLSYKMQTISHIRADMEQNNGLPSEAALLAMSTLLSHGATGSDDLDFTELHDPIQNRKAFGTATDMHYYSAIDFEYTHWYSVTRFLNRQGTHIITWPLMRAALNQVDSTVAWRRLEVPALPLLLPTDAVMAMATHQPDAQSTAHTEKLLSGLPGVLRTTNEEPYSSLYMCLVNMRVLVVRYSQYQRRMTSSRAGTKPDLRLIHFTRSLVLHDLLSMPVVETAGLGLSAVYELARHAALAFMQLVLFPISAVNETPRKLLEQMVPLLKLCLNPQRQSSTAQSARGATGRSQDQPQPRYMATSDAAELVGGKHSLDDPIPVPSGLLLHAWVVAGMLALEHFQTNQSKPRRRRHTSMSEAPIAGEASSVRPPSTSPTSPTSFTSNAPSPPQSLFLLVRPDDSHSFKGSAVMSTVSPSPNAHNSADPNQSSDPAYWMDALAPMLEDLSVKPEKDAWPMVAGMMESFLWLDSECTRVGREWWNYACLACAVRRSL